MKPPKYTGPKKNHSAIWIGQVVKTNEWDRIRILKSSGKWEWISDADWYLAGIHCWIEIPCWLKYVTTKLSPVAAMKKYDKKEGRRTVFLGYVRDTE